MQVFGKDEHGNIQIEYNGIHYAVPDILPEARNEETGQIIPIYTPFTKMLRDEISAWVAEGRAIGTFEPYQPTINYPPGYTPPAPPVEEA